MLDLDALYGFHEELAGGTRSPRVNAALTYLTEIECYHPDDDETINRLYYSEDFSLESVWLPFYGDRPVVDSNAATAPDSTVTADYVHGTVYGGLVQTVKVQPSTQYTLSVYVKLGNGANTDGFLRLGWGGDVVSGFDEYIDQTDPQWASVNSSTWTRVYLTGFTGSHGYATVLLPNAADGKYLQIWGAQFQMGTLSSYRKTEGAPTRTLRFSSLPYTSQIDDVPAQTHYESRLLQPGLIRRDLFSPGQPGGAISIGYGLVEIINTGDLDEYTAASFDGRSFVLKCGRVDQPLRDFVTVLVATMEQAEFTFTRLTIKLRDKLAELNNPITTKKYLGDGTDLEGDADLKDRYKPISFGYIRNITPVLINETLCIYQASSLPMDGMLVYEGGLQISPESLYTSQADMIANAPSASRVRVWPDGGMFRLGFSPTMAITVNCVSEPNSAGDCLKFMAESGGWTDTINTDDVTAVNAALSPATVGQFIDNGGTALEAMNAIAAGLGVWFGPDRLGELRMGLLEEPTGTPVISLTSADIITLERSATQSIPAKQITLKYRKNWTKQTEFDGSVSASEQQWRRQDNLQVIAADTANAIGRKLAPVLEFDSRITSPVDNGPQQTAYRLLTLYGTPRDLFTLRVRTRLEDTLILDLNEVVSVTYPRFGMDTGRLFRVIGIQADYRLGQLDLTLWG